MDGGLHDVDTAFRGPYVGSCSDVAGRVLLCEQGRRHQAGFKRMKGSRIKGDCVQRATSVGVVNLGGTCGPMVLSPGLPSGMKQHLNAVHIYHIQHAFPAQVDSLQSVSGSTMLTASTVSSVGRKFEEMSSITRPKECQQHWGRCSSL